MNQNEFKSFNCICDNNCSSNSISNDNFVLIRIQFKMDLNSMNSQLFKVL